MKYIYISVRNTVYFTRFRMDLNFRKFITLHQHAVNMQNVITIIYCGSNAFASNTEAHNEQQPPDKWCSNRKRETTFAYDFVLIAQFWMCNASVNSRTITLKLKKKRTHREARRQKCDAAWNEISSAPLVDWQTKLANNDWKSCINLIFSLSFPPRNLTNAYGKIGDN